MGNNIAIEFEHVSKQYRLGLVSTKTLSHDIRRFWITNVLHREDPYLKIGEVNDRSSKGNSEYVWALRDIDFKVEQGDVVGIIGKNGAGKSTLLKLLSRVTGPTTGTIRAHGRIGSLLEVGTGFHGEMTGRENIFMNGAILGMTRSEIQAKLDEIIDFSGCERYIDTPVKRYSSGMTVRLGFAVAAFLEPEILVVDEVLAVGDAEFQKKAIGKMKDVSQGQGRTVLFVSHNMDSIRKLCNTGVVLDKGQVQFRGSAVEAVRFYLDDGSGIAMGAVDVSDSPRRLSGMKRIIKYVELRNAQGESCNIFGQDDDIYLHVFYDATNYGPLAGSGFIIYGQDDERVGGGNTYMATMPPHHIPQKGEIVFHIDAKQFTPGNFEITVSVGPHQSMLADKIERCIGFKIEACDVYGTGYYLSHDDGVSLLRFDAKAIER